MAYTEEVISNFNEEYSNVHQGLQDLMLKNVVAGHEIEDANAKEHLLYGAARRLSVIKKAVENIFTLFPPTIDRPLERDTLYDVQINLHAYVINISGIFDNWAWAFVQRHGLLEQVGGKHGVGLFKNQTAQFLPQILKEYLSSNTFVNWQKDYIKEYRDALAHRIPLYIPPAEFTTEEEELYNQLEAQKIDLIKQMDWVELDRTYAAQEDLGRPSFVFLHSYSKGVTNQVLFHPQVLCDGLAVIEFGNLFMKHWGISANRVAKGL
jgi:hypothetical protein